jgi:hypothetical protein
VGPSVSALVTNHNYARYVGEALVRVCSARLTDTPKVVGRVGGGVGPDHLDNSIGKQFWINIVLTILGYIPGIVHAVCVIAIY